MQRDPRAMLRDVREADLAIQSFVTGLGLMALARLLAKECARN